MAAKNVPMFRSTETSEGEYSTLELDIWSQVAGFRYGPGTLRMTWYHRHTDHANGWNGFNLEVNARCDHDWEDAVNLIRRLRGRPSKWGEIPLPLAHGLRPQHVLARLTSLHAVEVTYDSRVSALVPLAQLAPPEYSRWIDAYADYGQSSCTAECLARDEEEARALIAAALASKVRYENKLIAWLNANRPVECDTGKTWGKSKPPDRTTLAQRIAAVEPVPQPEAAETPTEGAAA